MVRLKCKKCSNVFDIKLSTKTLLGSIKLGPYHRIKCIVCGKKSFFNLYSSVKDPVTWPADKASTEKEPTLTEDELIKKQIEDSKYETL